MRLSTRARLAVLGVFGLGALGACGRTGGTDAAPAPSPTTTPGATTTAAPSGSTAMVTDAASDAPARAIVLHHVLGTGQSLASGTGGSPPLSTSQPYDNRMLATGALAGAPKTTSFVPLAEQSVETMSSSFANLVTKLTRDAGGTHDLVVSAYALGGAPYSLMKKGTAAYDVSIAQATVSVAYARANGITYDITAVTSADGGGDHVAKNTHLSDDLAQWQQDFDADLRGLTGQTTAIPLFNTQYSSWTEYDATSPIPIAQLRAHVDHPGKVIVVGPRYPFLYGPDGVHLTNEGYRMMGEYYARAYRRVVVEHGTWEPLRPKSIARTAAVVTVRFLVPAPPLVFDTTRASNPGNMGFEYADDGPSTPTITSVAITATDTVTVTLSAEPTGANRRLRYAYTGTKGALAGLQTGAHGNLRDSDTTPSRNGYALFDWCVHFDEPVP
jgi:lysophospholipase L1-like esterase